jgi:DNA-binding CsgD family transcriptional regulator
VELMFEFRRQRPAETGAGWATSYREMLFRYMDGDLEAAATASEGVLLSEEAPRAWAHLAFRFGVRPRSYLGRLEAVSSWFMNSEDRPTQPPRSVLLAAFGRPDEARVVLLREREWATEGATGAPDSWPTSSLVLFLEAATLIENADLAAWFAAPLWDYGAVTTGHLSPTMVNRHLGAAAALLGEPDRARRYYERALAEAIAMQFRPEVALTRLGLAELLLSRFPASRAEALEHLAFASAEFEAMNMTPSLERAHALHEQAAALPRPRPSFPDGLSGREVEVLRLLAAGRTNQQIADTLFISLNTVLRHVSNIFDKTGAANRTEAAAYAHRHGFELPGD